MPEKLQKMPTNSLKWLKSAQKCTKVFKRQDFIVLVYYLQRSRELVFPVYSIFLGGMGKNQLLFRNFCLVVLMNQEQQGYIIEQSLILNNFL